MLAPMSAATPSLASRHFTTSDGVRLHVLEGGARGHR